MKKSNGKVEITPIVLLERLVENALDFLTRAISEFQGAPKYSIIHFSAAVEQFLKARLMAEHWSLVVSNRQEADWGKFTGGDFQSVTIYEAVSKLEKVARSGLSKEAYSAFDTIAKHRNRAIHFFHTAHTNTQAQKELQKIAKEQLRAWFYLHRLLQNQWSNVFDPWLAQINSIEEQLKSYREFLSLVFEEVMPKIKECKNACSSV